MNKINKQQKSYSRESIEKEIGEKTQEKVSRIINNMDRWFPKFFRMVYDFRSICHNYVAYKTLSFNGTDIVVPDDYLLDWEVDFWSVYSFGEYMELYFRISSFSFLEQNKDYFIKSILDEDLQYEYEMFWDFQVWKISNAQILSLYNIYEAIPALLEAWLHDENEKMRFACLEGLSNMKEWVREKLYDSALDIAKYLFRSDKWISDKTRILDLLAVIWNKDLVPLLRNIIEDLVMFIEFHEKRVLWWWNKVLLPFDIYKDKKLLELVDIFIKTLETIFELDANVARELWATFTSDLIKSLYWRELTWTWNIHTMIHLPNEEDIREYWK